MEVARIDCDALFRVFTACGTDQRALIFDARPHKQFSKRHVANAFCVRVSTAAPPVLLDYSGSSYSIPWSKDCCEFCRLGRCWAGGCACRCPPPRRTATAAVATDATCGGRDLFKHTHTTPQTHNTHTRTTK